MKQEHYPIAGSSHLKQRSVDARSKRTVDDPELLSGSYLDERLFDLLLGIPDIFSINILNIKFLIYLFFNSDSFSRGFGVLGARESFRARTASAAR